MTKTVILMRHGHYNMDSRTQNLTERGIAQAASIGKQLFDFDYKPDAIYHSVLTRAVETAQTLKQSFNEASGIDVPLIAYGELTNPDYRNPVSPIQSFNDEHNLVVAVTHQPNIEDITHVLFGKSLSPNHAECYVFESEANVWRQFTKAGRKNILRP